MTKPGRALTCGMGKGSSDRSCGLGARFPASPPPLSCVDLIRCPHDRDSRKHCQLLNGIGPNGLPAPLWPPPPSSFLAPAGLFPSLAKHCGGLGAGERGSVSYGSNTPGVQCGERPPARRSTGEFSACAPVFSAGAFQTTVRPVARLPRAARLRGGRSRQTPLVQRAAELPTFRGGQTQLRRSARRSQGALRVGGPPPAAPLLSSGLWWRVVPPVP